MTPFPTLLDFERLRCNNSVVSAGWQTAICAGASTEQAYLIIILALAEQIEWMAKQAVERFRIEKGITAPDPKEK